MSKGLEELKRLAYENACCRCQYYIDNKCTNKGECVWKTIENELKELEERREMMKRFNDACVPMILDNEIETKLKAFEIIKKKQVNVSALLELDNLQQYNAYCLLAGGCEKLTIEEYELLIEVLA